MKKDLMNIHIGSEEFKKLSPEEKKDCIKAKSDKAMQTVRMRHPEFALQEKEAWKKNADFDKQHLQGYFI